MDMYTTTLTRIARSAISAHAEKRLGYQTNPGESCRYRYKGGSACVIGADLPDQLVEWIEHTHPLTPSPTVDDLVSGKWIEITDDYLVDTRVGREPMSTILQYMHDSLAGMMPRSTVTEAAFIELLHDLATGQRPRTVTW